MHLATHRWEGAAPPAEGSVAAPAPGEMLLGLHPASAREETAFPSTFGELEGAVIGFKVCATSLVRQSKRLQQLSAALGQRKPPTACEMGLALLSCASLHAVSDEFLKMLSQPPVM